MKERFPMEWVDRIFSRLSEYFGKKWDAQFDTTAKTEIFKMQWQSGLYGLTVDEIKKALDACKELANNDKYPPWCHEFFEYGKGRRSAPVREIKALEVA